MAELEMLQKVFTLFVKSWAKNDLEAGKTNAYPGAQKRKITSSGLTVTNIHSKGEGNSFAGSVIITEGEVVQWVMTYSGSYPKEVGLFLKECIMDGIATGEFLGGRGPHFFSSERYMYTNSLTTTCFHSFSGKEEVILLTAEKKFGARLGWMEFSANLIG